MSIKAGDAIKIERHTHSPTGGGLVDADATPTGVLVRNGVATVESVTVTRTSLGTYKVETTIPSSWDVGDEVGIRLSATVGDVADSETIWEETISSGAYAGTEAVAGAYCTREDIEIRYGSANVEKWADMNNSSIASEISDRIEWAIAQAYSDLNDELRGGPYTLPIDPIPTSLVDLAARWAAALLHESRAMLNMVEEGESGGPELEPLRRKIRRHKAGAIRFEGVGYLLASYPQVLEDTDPADADTVAIIISSD